MDKIILDSIIFIAFLVGALIVLKLAVKKRVLAALLGILAIGLMLRVYLSNDPYLHHWDERYHSLVAKNMVTHPLKPTLFDEPVMAHNEEDWIGTHVWLSKPPVPLWCMAGSIAVFGNTEIAVRIPSLLFSVFAIYLTFILTKKLFGQRLALLAAFLHAINGLVIESMAGRVSSDHVETFFIIFVELALYFVILSLDGKKVERYLIFAGLFTGLAFLSKWFPALIVFPVWFIAFLFSKNFSGLKLFIYGGILFFTTALVITPWLVRLMAFEDDILWKVLFAFSEPIQNHAHPFYYYWHQIMIIFGELIYLPIALGVYFAVKNKNRQQNLLLLAWIFIPLIVFTLGGTKRHTYILIAAPAFFILTSQLFFYLLEFYNKTNKKLLIALFMTALVVLPIRYTAERLKLFQAAPELPTFYVERENWEDKFDDNDVVFGLRENIELMFYTDVAAAYNSKPSFTQSQEIKAMGYDIYYYHDGEFFEEEVYLKMFD